MVSRLIGCLFIKDELIEIILKEYEDNEGRETACTEPHRFRKMGQQRTEMLEIIVNASAMKDSPQYLYDS